LEHHSNFTGFILLFISLLIWSQVIYLHFHSLSTWLLEIFLWHFWDTSRILLDLFSYFRAYLQGSRTSPDFSTPSLLWADLAHHLPTTANSPSHGAAGIFCLVAWGGVLANPIQNWVPQKNECDTEGTVEMQGMPLARTVYEGSRKSLKQSDDFGGCSCHWFSSGVNRYAKAIANSLKRSHRWSSKRWSNW